MHIAIILYACEFFKDFFIIKTVPILKVVTESDRPAGLVPWSPQYFTGFIVYSDLETGYIDFIFECIKIKWANFQKISIETVISKDAGGMIWYDIFLIDTVGIHYLGKNVALFIIRPTAVGKLVSNGKQFPVRYRIDDSIYTLKINR
jgi:hypothetical protein